MTAELSNIGEQMLKSYMKGRKRMAEAVTCFFQPRSGPVA